MRSTNIECDCCWVNDAIVIDHSTFTRRLINCYIVVLVVDIDKQGYSQEFRPFRNSTRGRGEI